MKKAVAAIRKVYPKAEDHPFPGIGHGEILSFPEEMVWEISKFVEDDVLWNIAKYIRRIGSGLFIRLFKAGKDYPAECRKTRKMWILRCLMLSMNGKSEVV